MGPFATASRLTPIHQMSLAVLSRAACASMSTTTTTTTTHDRGDRYGPMEWAQKTTQRNFTKIFYACCLRPALGLPLTAFDTLTTSGCVYDVISIYHGASGPESCTTLYFEVVLQVHGSTIGRQSTTVFGRVYQKSAIYYCLVADCVSQEGIAIGCVASGCLSVRLFPL